MYRHQRRLITGNQCEITSKCAGSLTAGVLITECTCRLSLQQRCWAVLTMPSLGNGSILTFFHSTQGQEKPPVERCTSNDEALWQMPSDWGTKLKSRRQNEEIQSAPVWELQGNCHTPWSHLRKKWFPLILKFLPLSLQWNVFPFSAGYILTTALYRGLHKRRSYLLIIRLFKVTQIQRARIR